MDAILTLFALPRGRIGAEAELLLHAVSPNHKARSKVNRAPSPALPRFAREGAGTWFSLHTRKNANLQRPVNTTLIPSLAQRGREGAATSFDPPRVSACLAQSATSDDHATLSNTTTASVCPAMQRPIMPTSASERAVS